jgi:hypothetical protein
VKLSAAAASAQSRNADPVAGHACADELSLQRLSQVDSRRTVEIRPFREQIPKPGRDLAADRKTARSDTRPKGDPKSGGAQPLDRRRADSEKDSAPTGVQGRHGSGALVGDQDRQAIGGANGDHAAGIARDEAIALAGRIALGIDDPSGMHLTKRD